MTLDQLIERGSPFDDDDIELDEEGQPDLSILDEEGDPDEDYEFDEEGDFDDDDDDEEGDFDDDDEDEQGAVRGKRSKKAKRRGRLLMGPMNAKKIGKLARLKRDKKKLAANPKSAKKARKALKLHKMINNSSVTFVRTEGGLMLSSSLGSGAKLSPGEVHALKTFAYSGRVVEPQVYALGALVPPVPGAIGLYLENGVAYPQLQGVPWWGYILTLEASNFNMTPGGTFTLNTFTRSANVAPQVYCETQTFQIKRGFTVMQVVNLIGQNIAGTPRMLQSYVQSNLAPPAGNPEQGVVVNGLPASYTAKIRLLVPGDATFRKFAALL